MMKILRNWKIFKEGKDVKEDRKEKEWEDNKKEE